MSATDSDFMSDSGKQSRLCHWIFPGIAGISIRHPSYGFVVVDLAFCYITAGHAHQRSKVVEDGQSRDR